jgi:NNP family nitrate/nitrite transporter-like MFS transporter
MYATFTPMLISLLLLAAPFGYIVLETPDGPKNVLPYSLGVEQFTVLLFIVGCSMGIGKAAVFKHIPEYFPHDVGAVGGLVGTLGALGGFLLPPLFVLVREKTGLPQSTFIVLFLLTLSASVWMHVVIMRLLSKESPQLEHRIDTNTSLTIGA